MRLSDRALSEQALGSPVRAIRTPGSAGGDGHKATCRFGEGTAPKGAATARLRYGYRAEARPYPPNFERGCEGSHRTPERAPDAMCGR
jgi:hypothetical protein